MDTTTCVSCSSNKLLDQGFLEIQEIANVITSIEAACPVTTEFTRQSSTWMIIQSLSCEQKLDLKTTIRCATMCSSFLEIVTVLPSCFAVFKKTMTTQSLIDALVSVWSGLSLTDREKIGDIRSDHDHTVWKVVHLYHAMAHQPILYTRQEFYETCTSSDLTSQITNNTCNREVISLIADRFVHFIITKNDLSVAFYSNAWTEFYRLLSSFDRSTVALVMADVAARGLDAGNASLIQGLVGAEFGCVFGLVPLMRLPRKEVA